MREGKGVYIRIAMLFFWCRIGHRVLGRRRFGTGDGMLLSGKKEVV